MKNIKESSSDEEHVERIPLTKSEENKEKKLLNKKREKEKKEKKESNKTIKDDVIVGDKEVKFVLDSKKRITVHKFKGQLKVDIREFYEDNGEMKPGWKKFKGFIAYIDETIDDMK